MSFIKADGSVATDCFVATGQGLLEQNGGLFISPNTQTGYPLAPGAAIGNAIIVPVPGKQITLLATAANGVGTYLSIYDDLSKNLTPHYDSLPFRHLASYSVDKLPNRTIVDKSGAKIAMNVYGTLAFSANGKWAVVDAPTRGMLRINLETLEITPFEKSFSGVSDYSDKYVVTSISNDGRYVATAFYQYSEFKVYDLSTCSGSTNASYTQPLTCQYQNYWTTVGSKLSSFKNIYRLRFINNDNIAIDLTYNWLSSASFSAARYRLTAPGKAAHVIEYLALGDSYTSGQGSFVYKAGTDTATNKCHLSTLAYPFVVGEAKYNSYNSVACSGAKTKDITGANYKSYNTTSGGRQASGKETSDFDVEIFSSFLPGYRAQKEFIEQYQPSVVTVSIGGNDMGFGAILQACAMPQVGLPPVSNTCFDNYYDRMQIVRAIQSVFPKLQAVYRDIIAADPGVRLYAVGYPQIAALGDCAANVHLDASEIVFSEHLIAYLNSVVRKAAQSSGAYYVDIENAFDGHRMCETASSRVAVNGLTRGNDNGPFGIKIIGSESYHPNQLGNQLIARTIMQQTAGLTSPIPAAVSVTSPSAYDPLAQILLNNYVIGNEAIPGVVTIDDTIAEDVVSKSTPQTIAIDGRSNGLRPNSSYQLSVGSAASSTAIGSFSTDVNAEMTATVTIPSSVATGAQSILITGINLIDQPIVIYKYVYVIADNNDYDGDSISNSDEQCLIIPASASDADADAIDDACDPDIGLPLAESLFGQVYLIDNKIEIRR